MNLRRVFVALVVVVGAFAAVCPLARAKATAPAASQLPPDPWPRVIDLSNAQVLVYQPQVEKWTDQRIQFRCALAIKPEHANEAFGVVFANARTQVDKVGRTVVFEDMQITKTDFPTLPDHGAAYTSE